MKAQHHPPAPRPAPYTVMAKPAGPACDYACEYCYYRAKKDLLDTGRAFRMSDTLLETFIGDYIASQPGPEIEFTWQGGEPTLLGRTFYEKAFRLQERHLPAGRRITNAIQTHGGHLDGDWARFLKEHEVLVGLSIDGPRTVHDRFRKDLKGRPTFGATRKCVKLLRKHGVAFNTLTVVHAANAGRGGEIYRFLKRIGVRHMQFIPLVERVDEEGREVGPGSTRQWPMSALSVPPEGYGTFLCAVFDEWSRGDVGKVFVQSFDVLLALHLGLPSPLCVFAETCGQGLVLEHDGSLFACDHYVYPDYRLGSIRDTPLDSLARGEAQQAFAAAKAELPEDCRECPELGLCHGGCPKHRFMPDREGGRRLNYLCPSYRGFFAHSRNAMSRMAGRISRPGVPLIPR